MNRDSTPDCPLQSVESATTEWNQSESPVTAIVEAVGAVTGRDPISLEPLETQIDTDALNALIQKQPRQNLSTNGAGSGSVVQVSFTYEGCWVVVENTGRVEVTPIPETE